MLLATLILTFGPAGVDRPAHQYQLWLFGHFGFRLWDNFWYAGRYSFVGYSILFYPLSQLIGMGTTVVMSVGLGVWAVSMMVSRLIPTRLLLACLLATLLWPTEVLSGAYPYMLSQALGAVVVLLVLADGRLGIGDYAGGTRSHWLGNRTRKTFIVALLVLQLGASPLGVLFVELFLIARFIRLADLDLGRAGVSIRGIISSVYKAIDLPLVAGSAVALVGLVSSRLFPTMAYYPFWWTDLAEIVAFVLLVTLVLPRRGFRFVRIALGVYLLVCLVAFFVPTELGSNIGRLSDASLFGSILIVSLIWARAGVLRRIFSVFLILFSAYWWSTLITSALTDPQVAARSTSAYWSGAVSWLEGHLGTSYRVELVDPSDHSGDYYLAKSGIPLVRGWFRQADFPTDALLYRSSLTATTYLAWLHDLSVKFVALPSGPYDFSSQKEAQLVKRLSATKDCLTQVANAGDVTLYSVCNPVAIVSGGNAVVMGRTSITARLPAGGTYRLSIHFSPYLIPSTGCLYRSSNGLTRWNVTSHAVASVRFHLSLTRMLTVFFSDPSSVCAG